LGLIKRGWIWVLAFLLAAGIFAAFLLGKKTEPDYFTAKVEKGDIRAVLAGLEARTGRRVEFQDDEARKAGKG